MRFLTSSFLISNHLNLLKSDLKMGAGGEEGAGGWWGSGGVGQCQKK